MDMGQYKEELGGHYHWDTRSHGITTRLYSRVFSATSKRPQILDTILYHQLAFDRRVDSLPIPLEAPLTPQSHASGNSRTSGESHTSGHQISTATSLTG